MNKADDNKKLVEKMIIIFFFAFCVLIGVSISCESNAKQKAEQQAKQEALDKAEFAKTPEGIAQAKAEKARKEKE